MTSASDMVRLLWVMTTNWVVSLMSAMSLEKRPTLVSSSGASTSSSTQKGAGWILEDADQQRERGEGLLSAREQEDVLQLLARRRGDEVDAGLVAVLGVGELHVGLAAAEELGEGDGEVLVDDLEGLVELGVRDVVDLLDGGLCVFDGVEQVLALAFHEGVAACGLVVLLEGHHVDGAHGFEALLEAACLFFFGGEGFAFDADDGLVGAEDGGFDGMSLRQVASMCSMSEASLAARAVRSARCSRECSVS